MTPALPPTAPPMTPPRTPTPRPSPLGTGSRPSSTRSAMIHLNNIWFIIIAIFWVGYFILEGFDFGVGMLHSFVGRTDVERRIAVNSIGPIWDGNEVWLVVGGAAIFAAFPSWYATMFSTFYLALLIVLVALIVRGVSFEYHR